MGIKTSIKNIVTDSYLYKKHQQLQKKQFTVVNSILISLAFIAVVFTIYKLTFFIQNRELAMFLTILISTLFFSTITTKIYKKNIDNLKCSHQQIQKQQLKLHSQLYTNPQTLSPNQYALEEYLKSSKKNLSLMLLDIDAFDNITSEFGKQFSDKIIQQVYHTLDTLTSNEIPLFHLSQHRFAYVVDSKELNKDISLAKSIKALFENLHLTSENIDIFITLSIGIARKNNEKIIINANSALTEIKLNGRNGYKLFDNSTVYEKQYKNNIYWAKRIKEIILENNLIVHYQPIVNNQTKKIEKYECLVRAVDDKETISPNFFLEVAKSRGYLKNITKIIIDKSFKEFQNNNFEFSINITEDDLADKEIVGFLKYKIDQYVINPKRVYLEILESVTSLQSIHSEEIFREFKKMGFNIAIDDFGTKTSNFSRVLELNVDIIKIDGSFIKNLDVDENSVKIVETIVSFAKKIDAKTTAEFVHNKEIYEIVKALGVDYSQGYYFSKPLPKPQ
jgi:diguanylate cyclase (GGDEF)-like protein